MGLYWFLAFAVAWAVSLPVALQVHGVAQFGLPPGISFLIGFAPAIAALIAAAAQGQLRDFWRGITRWRAPLWSWVAAVLLPPAMVLGGLALEALRGRPFPHLIVGPAVAGFAVAWLILGLGEEIGWRGFALPRLIERHGFLAGSLVLGVAWAVWHYPKLYASPQLHGWSGLEMVALFSVQIVLANFVICALFELSGRSVLVAGLFHAAFDTMATVYWQAALDPYVTAVMAVVAGVVVLAALRQRGSGRREARLAGP